MKPSKLKFVMPFVILFSLFALLGYELFYAKPQAVPSRLIGERLPSFNLPLISQPTIFLTDKQLSGRVTLLNVWSSWCYACTMEAPMLMKIKNDYHVEIYGIVYKDDARSVQDWLKKHGNPFTLIGDDKNGDVVIDLGVYGTPETFVINPVGEIVYRHVGVIDQKNWDEVIYPIIQKYSGSPL